MRKKMESDMGNREEYEKKQRKYSHKRVDVKEISKKKHITWRNIGSLLEKQRISADQNCRCVHWQRSVHAIVLLL